ncbi:hypothetical protein CK911_07085 [Aeromonas sp. CU5]|nr:hypothetical protein CK911_07085 [Aeromonas sp. CU5]
MCSYCAKKFKQRKSAEPAGKGDDKESGKRKEKRAERDNRDGGESQVKVYIQRRKTIRPARGLIDHKVRVVADQRARTTRPLR